MIDDKYLSAFFGRQPDYYLNRYKSFQSGKKFIFNPAAWFFGVFWLLYRKLWVEAFILLFIGLVIQLFFEWLLLDYDTQMMIYTYFPASIILGFLANYFYLIHSERAVNKILHETTDEDKRIRQLKRTGGVNLIVPVIFILILVSFFTLLNILNAS